jgi:hypothetical protein
VVIEMGRTGLKPTPEERPIVLKESKLRSRVLLKRKNHTSLVKTPFKKFYF